MAKRQKFIELELAKNPHAFDKLRCNEVIDKQTLTHVVCNTDCPEGVEFGTFRKCLNAVCEVLNIFPYVKLDGMPDTAAQRKEQT